MYNFLLITSNENSGAENVKEQIEYLNKFSISTTILIDPTEIELITCLKKNEFDAAYVHIKRRVNCSNYNFDPVMLLQHFNIPTVGNSYITQLMIADKCFISSKSGIGVPSQILTREMWKLNEIPYESINNIGYPVIIKPNSLHASQGISQDSIIFSSDKILPQVENIFNRFPYLSEILIEKFIEPATEYTVSVLGNNNSLACSVTKLSYKNDLNHHLYSENEKNLDLSKRNVKFEIEHDNNIRERLESLSKALFNYFGMKDFARFDYIKNDKLYLLEANCCPIPGNSFSWEWQIKYNLKKCQVLALFLCSFHFSQVASGRPDNLPFSLIYDLPKDITEKISYPSPVDVKPECTERTVNCDFPQRYSMNSRVGTESEVVNFLRALTILIKPKIVLETGTYNGNGTIAFAEAVHSNGFGKVVSIEYDSKLAARAKRKFVGYPVEIINGNSLSYTPKEPIDILFLDSKRSIRKEEFLRYKPFLHDKSIIIWHDSAYREKNHAVFDAINELYELKIIDKLLLPTPRGITLSMLRKKN